MKRHWSIAIVLLAIAITFPVIEIMLRIVDPWGANAYYTDLSVLQEQYIADPQRGYVIPSGIIKLRHWSLTMTKYGRVVPATTRTNKVVAFVGDSLTMGHAVNDESTFANQLAIRFPACEFRNYGINGYNANQVANTIRSIQADKYIYVLISNDAEPMLDLKNTNTNTHEIWLAIKQYWYHWLKSQSHRNRVLADSSPIYPHWFWLAIRSMALNEDVLMFGFDGQSLSEAVAKNYPKMTLIPHYITGVSKADPHPDIAGHKRIADAIAPYLTDCR